MGNSKINELASKLNEMKNPSKIGTSIGEVVATEPFTVSIAGGAILLTEGEELRVAEKLKKTKYDATLEWTSGNMAGSATIADVGSGALAVTGSSGKSVGKITIDPKVKKGDNILVVPTDSEQTWIAVDRIGG